MRAIPHLVRDDTSSTLRKRKFCKSPAHLIWLTIIRVCGNKSVKIKGRILNSLLSELRRRNMFRVAGMYAIVGWILMQVAVALEGAIGLPVWFDGFIVATLLIGFPVAMLLAWAYEMTPEGVKRTESVPEGESITAQTGRKLDIAILAGLAVLIAVTVGGSVLGNSKSDGEIGSASVSAEASETAIAVLPFADMSADGDQEYFADGISEELLNLMAQIPGLDVAGRTSAFAFKGQNKDLREIGNLLDVTHILEGSVRKSENRIRVTAQLIRVDNGFHVWSETYDRELTDIFAVQDDISSAILTELKPQLVGEITPVKVPRLDISAYDFYLLARQKAAAGTFADYKEAAAALDKVLAIDADFVSALAWRGAYELAMSDGAGYLGDIPFAQAWERAGEWTSKALALDPNSADALYARALWLSSTSDQEQQKQSTRYFELALAARPSFAQARNDYGMTLEALGQFEDAMKQFELAVAHDPAQSDANSNLAYRYGVGRRQYGKAEAQLARWEAISPKNPYRLLIKANIEIQQGDLADAFNNLQAALEMAPDDPRILREQTQLLFSLGEFETVLRSQDKFHPVLLFLMARFEEALSLAESNFRDQPGKVEAELQYLSVHFLAGKWDEIIEYYNLKGGNIEAFENSLPYLGYGWVAASMSKVGHPDAAAIMERYQARNREFRSGYDNHDVDRGDVSIMLLEGRDEQALQLLEQMVAKGYRGFYIFVHPELDPLRRNPRFKTLSTQVATAINAERVKLDLPAIEMPRPYIPSP